MKALSVERSICEGNKEVKELFEFVTTHAGEMTAYQLEQERTVDIPHLLQKTPVYEFYSYLHGTFSKADWPLHIHTQMVR